MCGGLPLSGESLSFCYEYGAVLFTSESFEYPEYALSVGETDVGLALVNSVFIIWTL